jgi:hypothetical protein
MKHIVLANCGGWTNHVRLIMTRDKGRFMIQLEVRENRGPIVMVPLDNDELCELRDTLTDLLENRLGADARALWPWLGEGGELPSGVDWWWR